MSDSRRTYPPAMERVAARTRYEDRGYKTPCRVWLGCKDENGYGLLRVGGRLRRVHSRTYEDAHGPVPVGLELDHLCRVPACCEVTHLEAVTHAENHRRGIQAEVSRARCAAITHCPRNHEYTPENTEIRIDPRGGWKTRRCRQCHRDKQRARYHRRRALQALQLPALIVACFLWGYLVVPAAKAGTNAKAPVAVAAEPTGPCNFAHRMDIEIIEGTWHECMCLALTMGWDCAWVKLPQPAVAQIRRRIRSHHHPLRAQMPRAWAVA